jgi:hypothetical protein
MYIWKVNALVQDLRWGRIRWLDKIRYGGLMFVIASLCWLGVTDHRFDPVINGMLIFSAQAISAYISYCINSHGDGRDFWMRFYTLGVPVALHSVCVVMPVMFFASLPPYTWKATLGNAAQIMQVLSSLPDVLVLTCGILLWGWRVSVHIEQAARQRP